MISAVKRLFGLLLFCGMVAVSGCTDSSSSALEEEREPHFLEGKARVNTMDYSGAIESFEQALETNPRSAAAHFELGCLCDQRDADPAAAIYHYGRYLKLRPNGDKAQRARDRITACQQQLAKVVSLGPISQTLQREHEAMTEELKKLREENRLLRDRLAQYESTALRQHLTAQVVSDSTAASPTASRFTSAPTVRDSSTSRPSEISARTHTVIAGETAGAIAKKYGVRLESLMAANPRLEPRRMRIGQALNIPSS